VYNNSLLLIDTDLLQGCIVIFTSITGVVMLGAAAEGFFFSRIHVALRILLAGGAMCFLTPNMVQDLVGLTIAMLVMIVQWRKAKNGCQVLELSSVGN
jgi:TRAP-type uncharacterized transport system fused permease subunit